MSEKKQSGSFLTILLLLLITTAFSRAAEKRQFIELTGWGGGNPETVVPQAAEVGFDEIVLWNNDPKYLKSFVDEAKKYNIGIFGAVTPNSRKMIKNWKKEYEILKRINDDKSPDKSQYQWGGEPVPGTEEVLNENMLCFHQPDVKKALKKKIKNTIRTPRGPRL